MKRILMCMLALAVLAGCGKNDKTFDVLKQPLKFLGEKNYDSNGFYRDRDRQRH